MKLEPMSVAQQIYNAIQALGREGQRLESDNLIAKKAEAMCEYDKALGVSVATLKLNGEPVGVIDKLSKGECAELLSKKIVAEETLRAHYSKLERLEATVNALQSINRYLTHLPTGD